MIFVNSEQRDSPRLSRANDRRATFNLAGGCRKLALAFLLCGLAALAACTSDSSTFGQYFQGRTLHVSVISLEQVPELRYSTIDPNQIVRQWSMSPSTPGNELVLARLKVENHTAVSAIINIDRSAAELRDFSNNSYRPLTVSQTVWQDFRGEPEALVRMDLGQCFDGTRALVDSGTTVRWRSEAKVDQYVAFGDAAVGVGPGGRAELAPGESLTHTFSQPGNYPYVCGGGDLPEFPAEVRVAPGEEPDDAAFRSVQFLEGSFELLRGHGLDGYMVFEVPAGTEFRDLRWRAGDSVTIRF